MTMRFNLYQSFHLAPAGMSFQELYQKCREAFLVNSDLTLRAQLTEFRDHKLIKSKKVSSHSRRKQSASKKGFALFRNL